MGIFGFLSKAHSDQSLVSGDVQAKIAVYDEKIKTEKENIEANRKALKQMDEAVDQSMARSTTEQGANRAVNIRQSQARERTRLQTEITTSQKKIAGLNEERAPIAAEVRKVEAEVGPIKYIAAFVYGSNPDANILEKAVTWVIIIIVSVFDPLAVILLLASQYSFQYFREREAEEFAPVYVADVGEPPTAEEKEAEGDSPTGPDVDVISTDTTVTELPFDPHPPGWMYVDHPHYEPDDGPLTEEQVEQIRKAVAEELPTGNVIETSSLIPEEQPEYVNIDGQRMHYKVAKEIYNTRVPTGAYVQNEEQNESSKWNRVISEAEYRDQAQLKKQDDSKNNTDNTA
jgi:hypothetical protein